MAGWPPWLLGKHLVTFTVTGQTVAADGTFANSGAAKSLVGVTKSLKLRSNPLKDNVSAVTMGQANKIIGEEDNTVDIEVQLKNNGENVLTTMANFFDVIKVIWTQGSGGGGSFAETVTFYGSRGPFETGIESKTNNTSRLTLEQVAMADGSANPIITQA